jgi:hypothetical protein
MNSRRNCNDFPAESCNSISLRTSTSIRTTSASVTSSAPWDAPWGAFIECAPSCLGTSDIASIIPCPSPLPALVLAPVLQVQMSIQYSSVQYSTAQHSTIQHRTRQQNTVQCMPRTTSCTPLSLFGENIHQLKLLLGACMHGQRDLNLFSSL